MKKKGEFAVDFEKSRKRHGYSSHRKFADAMLAKTWVRIAETTAASWSRGIFPLSDKWAAIQEMLDIDCSEYEDDDQPITITSSPQSQGTIKDMDWSN